ncbi:MAG: FxsA family protein [Halobacteriaceae archaeon]
MRRLGWLLLALLVIPLADALFLVFVAVELGWKLTVALVVLTALVGMVFVRAEGRHTMRKIQRAVAEGRAPTDELLDGALLLVAGAFLLTPGLVTDGLGLLLVFRPTRYPFRLAVKRFVVPKLDERSGGFATGNVYTFGFPGGDGGPSDGNDAATGGETVDLGEDDYDVQFGDEDDRD